MDRVTCKTYGIYCMGATLRHLGQDVVEHCFLTAFWIPTCSSVGFSTFTDVVPRWSQKWTTHSCRNLSKWETISKKLPKGSRIPPWVAWRSHNVTKSDPKVEILVPQSHWNGPGNTACPSVPQVATGCYRVPNLLPLAGSEPAIPLKGQQPIATGCHRAPNLLPMESMKSTKWIKST